MCCLRISNVSLGRPCEGRVGKTPPHGDRTHRVLRAGFFSAGVKQTVPRAVNEMHVWPHGDGPWVACRRTRGGSRAVFWTCGSSPRLPPQESGGAAEASERSHRSDRSGPASRRQGLGRAARSLQVGRAPVTRNGIAADNASPRTTRRRNRVAMSARDRLIGVLTVCFPSTGPPPAEETWGTIPSPISCVPMTGRPEGKANSVHTVTLHLTCTSAQLSSHTFLTLILLHLTSICSPSYDPLLSLTLMLTHTLSTHSHFYPPFTHTVHGDWRLSVCSLDNKVEDTVVVVEWNDFFFHSHMHLIRADQPTCPPGTVSLRIHGHSSHRGHTRWSHLLHWCADISFFGLIFMFQVWCLLVNVKV